MAKIGRSALNGGLQSRFPDNIIKFITALRARLQLTDISDSKFNLEDDTASDIKYDNAGTDLVSTNLGDVINEINSRNQVIGFGTIEFPSTHPGGNGTVIPTTGIFTNCVVVDVKQEGAPVTGVECQVTMPDIGTSSYNIVITYGVPDNGINNRQLRAFSGIVNGSKLNTGFKIVHTDAIAPIAVGPTTLEISLYKI